MPNYQQVQFKQMYFPEEASVQVNKHMEQIYSNQVLPQNCSPFTDYPAAWEALLQTESEQTQFNQMYAPDKALARVNKPMEQIHKNQEMLQSCSASPDCPAALGTLLNKERFEMQFNQTYFPDKALIQVDTPMEHMHYNQVVLQNCSAIPDCPAALGTTLHRDSVEKFQQKTDLTMNSLHPKGRRCLRNRRERNRERERKRQRRLRGAFNVLRSVIPDYFSEREPGDRLSRIQTLRLAKKYIATLQELLETS